MPKPEGVFVETAILLAGKVPLKDHMQHAVIRSWVVMAAVRRCGGEERRGGSSE